MTVYILSSEYEEAYEFINKTNLVDWRYINSPETVKDIEHYAYYVIFGNFWQRDDFEIIMNLLYHKKCSCIGIGDEGGLYEENQEIAYENFET